MKKSFGDRLKELRGNLSQEEFALKIGTKQTTLSNWERGFREPNFSGLAMISTSCEVSADWLLGLSEERSGRPGAAVTPTGDQEVEKLKAENAVLRGEVQGLKFALEAAMKGAPHVQDSASRGRSA